MLFNEGQLWDLWFFALLLADGLGMNRSCALCMRYCQEVSELRQRWESPNLREQRDLHLSTAWTKDISQKLPIPELPSATAN